MKTNLEKNKATLIAVTGADGSGKSSLCRNLSKAIQNNTSQKVSLASIWDVQAHSGMSYQEIQSYVLTLSSKERCLLIFSALRESLSLVEKQNSDFILFDAYWYKYAVNELVRGVNFALLSKLIASLPRPDLVLYLEVSPKKALERKKILSLYETGGRWQSQDNFLTLQDSGLKYWESFRRTYGPWFVLNAEHSQEDLVDEAFRSVCLESLSFS